MVVTYKRFGRLGNRLFLSSHLIAFSERFGVDVYFPAFAEFRKFFPYFTDASCAYVRADGAATEPHRDPGAWYRAQAFLGIIPTLRFWDDRDVVFDGDDADDARVRAMAEKDRVVFEGWKFRSHDTIISIMPTLKSVFKPREDIQGLVAERFSEARGRGDVVLGVHLRWEDYRDTPLFFPLDVFLARMQEIAGLLRPAKASFLITSPEKLDPAEFPPECIICSGGGPVHDLYTLAACDYIMGPSSTFSGWASFYGGKPLFAMREGVRFDDMSRAEIIRW